MSTVNEKIRQFFAEYEKAFEKGISGKPDVMSTVNSFSHVFVEASPLGIMGSANDNSFREAIPKGFEFYRKIGTKSMAIDKIDITPIDQYHYQAKVHWKAHYEQTKLEVDLEFDVIYLLQFLNNKLEIFAYITGDEQALLRKHGLI